MKPNASQKQALTNNPDQAPTSLLNEVKGLVTPHSESPTLDSLELLSHVTGLDRAKILAHPDPVLDPEQVKDLDRALKQIQKGTPLPYVLGKWEFFNHSFQISSDVLIPRPETEGLVELALDWLDDHPERRSSLELGTGCGCIAVSLAKALPDLKIRATDISPKALEIARGNARQHGVEDQIEFLECDLLNGVQGKVDLLIANLPYIPTRKLRTLKVFQTEPILALDGGEDGLYYIKQVLQNAGEYLQPGGAVFLEIDEDTGAAALQLAHDVWPGLPIQLDQDLAGQDRYLSIQCP
ncbi:MAG: peptide chain release factor N(5)-glutamine methyltransferase [Anaerolineales bacterium]|jgi:release factor glutamine methyltransferase